MSQSISYYLGRALGRLPTWGRLGVVTLAVVALYSMCSPSPTSTSSNSKSNYSAKLPAQAAKSAQELAAAELAKQREACQNTLAQRRAAYDSHMKERKYWDATLQLRQCAEVLANPDLLALLKDAEVKSHLAEINGSKTPLRDKVRAIELLARDYPDIGAKYQPEIPKLMAAAEKQEALAEARRKRSEGVHIGMTKADVLASSWGRPERINRTTTVYGTREQWIYGSGNYLYFEDNVLVSVQN